MALDGIFLYKLRQEFEQKILNCKVDKVSQPEKDEIILNFRGHGEDVKVIFSASANHPRVNITKISKPSPLQAPMLCMLFRKHLAGARLIAVTQNSLERALYFQFEGRDELGDVCIKTLAIEIMGRHSNIVLFDSNNKILGAVKYVDFSMSQVRQIQAGSLYKLPPPQDKTVPFDISGKELSKKLNDVSTNLTLEKWLLTNLQGVSPIICRELAYLVCKNVDIYVSELDDELKFRLAFHFDRLMDSVKNNTSIPHLIMSVDTKKPLDFAFCAITQYSTGALCQPLESYSELVDRFYAERDVVDRIKQRSYDILKLLSNLDDKLRRKVEMQRVDLEKCADREQLRMFADLLMANLYLIKTGDKSATVQNFYSEDNEDVTIPLDIRLSPHQNAQKYYKDYKRAKSAKIYLNEQINEGTKELEYIDSVVEALIRVRGEKDIDEIRAELIEQGYMSRHGMPDKKDKRNKKSKKAPTLMQWTTPDGFKIIAGRNNLQNEYVTFSVAENRDIWFHAKNIPGSHTVIICDGKKPTNETLTQAAIIAATFSKGAKSPKVDVDYTEVRNVKKIKGAKPGMVIYDNFTTAHVAPDESLIDSIN